MNAAVRRSIWIVVSIVVSVASMGLALLIGGIADDSFGESTVARLSVAAGVWPLPAAVITLALARAMLGVDFRGGLWRSLTIVGVGALGAAACAAALVIWTEGHFGRFDPEYVGPTWLLPLLIGAAAVAVGWALATRRYPGRFARVIFWGTSTLIALLAVLNLPGAFNGVSARGIPLMLAFGLAGAVVVGGLGSLRAMGR